MYAGDKKYKYETSINKTIDKLDKIKSKPKVSLKFSKSIKSNENTTNLRKFGKSTPTISFKSSIGPETKISHSNTKIASKKSNTEIFDDRNIIIDKNNRKAIIYLKTEKECISSNKSKQAKLNVCSQNYSEHKDHRTRIKTTEDDENEIDSSINYDNVKEFETDTTHNNLSNLMMENNIIRRDTFIDNNFNKKIRTDDLKKHGVCLNINDIKILNTNNKILEESIECTRKNVSNSFIASSFQDDFYNFNDKTINLTNSFPNTDVSELLSNMNFSIFEKNENTKYEYENINNERKSLNHFEEWKRARDVFEQNKNKKRDIKTENKLIQKSKSDSKCLIF